MNKFKCLLTAIALVIAPNLTAQDVLNDSTAQKKLPVQAFAAMPILVGLSAENAFPHEKKPILGIMYSKTTSAQWSLMIALLPIIPKHLAQA